MPSGNQHIVTMDLDSDSDSCLEFEYYTDFHEEPRWRFLLRQFDDTEPKLFFDYLQYVVRNPEYDGTVLRYLADTALFVASVTAADGNTITSQPSVPNIQPPTYRFHTPESVTKSAPPPPTSLPTEQPAQPTKDQPAGSSSSTTESSGRTTQPAATKQPAGSSGSTRQPAATEQTPRSSRDKGKEEATAAPKPKKQTTIIRDAKRILSEDAPRFDVEETVSGKPWFITQSTSLEDTIERSIDFEDKAASTKLLAIWEIYRKWLQIGKDNFTWENQKSEFDYNRHDFNHYHYCCSHLHILRNRVGFGILFLPFTKTQFNKLSSDTGIPEVLKWWDELEQPRPWRRLEADFEAVFKAYYEYDQVAWKEAVEELSRKQYISKTQDRPQGSQGRSRKRKRNQSKEIFVNSDDENDGAEASGSGS